MASVTIQQKPNELTLESIPTVDLRLLTQSELTALSLCSSHAFDLRRCDDVVIPKIDRSVFNESAGSRKQTYSRLRLAPRNKPNLKLRVIKPDNTPILDSERVENDRIVSLFKDLFRFSNGGVGDEVVQGDELAVVPVPVNFGEVDGNMKRKRGRKPGGGAGGVEDASDILTPSNVVVEYAEDEAENVSVEEVVRRCEEREKELVNKNGVVVNLAELAKMKDPYREELKRRTEGRESTEELLRFVTEVEGQWGSTRKKRKIVDANVFSDALPNGWKVLIAIKKKLGRAWVFVRRYVRLKSVDYHHKKFLLVHHQPGYLRIRIIRMAYYRKHIHGVVFNNFRRKESDQHESAFKEKGVRIGTSEDHRTTRVFFHSRDLRSKSFSSVVYGWYRWTT